MASHAAGGNGFRPAHARRAAYAGLTALALVGAMPADAAVLVNQLSDVTFGTISNVVADATQAESVCADTGILGGLYGVTATGSGSGGAFTLSTGGGATLAYQVQWAATSGQTSGTQLTSGTALTGQRASLLDCTLGLQTDASLIVILRAAALGGATAGSYTGTLQIMLAPN